MGWSALPVLLHKQQGLNEGDSLPDLEILEELLLFGNEILAAKLVWEGVVFPALL